MSNPSSDPSCVTRWMRKRSGWRFSASGTGAMMRKKRLVTLSPAIASLQSSSTSAAPVLFVTNWLPSNFKTVMLLTTCQTAFDFCVCDMLSKAFVETSTTRRKAAGWVVT